MITFKPIASSSKGNAYILESVGIPPLLIECGIPMIRLRQEIGLLQLTSLAGCLISHRHMDHARAVKDLMKSGIDVWTSKETAQDLGLIGHHRQYFLDTGERHVIEGWTVLPFDLHHDVPTHGFLISDHEDDVLLFVPDTAYVRNRFSHIGILAIECNNIEEIVTENIIKGYLPKVVGHRVRRNHMSLQRVISMITANDLSRCRQIWLLHLSDGNSDEERMIREVQRVTGVPVYVAQL